MSDPNQGCIQNSLKAAPSRAKRAAVRASCVLAALALACFVAGCATKPNQAVAPTASPATPTPFPTETPRPRLSMRSFFPDRGARGVVGPQGIAIVAVPLSWGGSGGAFNICVYTVSAGHAHTLVNIQANGGIVNVAVRHRRLIVTSNHWVDGDHNCCVSARDITTYRLRRNHFISESQSIVRASSSPPADVDGRRPLPLGATPWPMMPLDNPADCVPAPKGVSG